MRSSRTCRKQAKGSEDTSEQARGRLEGEWGLFQSEVGRYFEAIIQQSNQRQSVCEQNAKAQLKSWRKTAEEMQAASAEFAADSRAKVEATTRQMRAEAGAAEAKFERLTEAGTESWTSWNAALTESRAAFDRANHVAWESFKQVSP